MPLSSLIASPASRTVRVAGVLASLAAVAFAAFLPLSIAGIQIAWWVAALGVLGLMAAGERYRPTALAAPLALHAVTLGLSVAFAAWPARGQEAWNLWRLLAVPVLAFVFMRDRRTTRTALAALVVVACVMAPYALAQYFTGIDWLRVTGKTVRFAAAFAEGRFRPVGAYNAYSTFAFVYTSVGLVAAAGAAVSRGRLRPWLWAAAVLLIGTALLAQVRAAWMGAVAGALAMGWVRSRRSLLRAGLVVLLLGGVVVVSVPALRAKAVNTADFSYASNRDRVFMWARALEMVSDHPVTGTGHGSWTPSTEWYFDRWEPAFPVRCHAHDNFLHFWATTGPFGLFAFIWLLLAHFRQSGRAFRRAEGDGLAATAALAGVGVAAAFVAYALTQDPYFDGEAFYVLAFALALGIAATRWTRPNGPGPDRSRIVGVAVPVAVGLLAAAAAVPAAGSAGGLSLGRLAVPAGIALALAVASMDRILFRRLLLDGFTQSLALAAVVIVAVPLVVLGWLAPAAGVQTNGVQNGTLVALVAFAAALAARSFFLARPRPSRAVAGVGALLMAGLLGQALGHGEPWPSSGTWAAARPDVDADGVPDDEDGCMRFDPSQSDVDGDGVGDACEPVIDVVPLERTWWGVTPSQLLRLEVEEGTLRASVVRTFPPYADLSAIAKGRFLDDRPLLAVASRWDGDLRLLDTTGKTVLRHDFGAQMRWTALAAGRRGVDRPLLLAAAEGRPGLSVFEARRDHLKRWTGAPTPSRVQAIAALDLDHDGIDEVVTARRSGEAASRIEVRRLSAGLPVLWTDTVAFRVSRLEPAHGPTDAPVLRVLGEDGEVETWDGRPDGLEGPRHATRVAGGVRWLLQTGSGTWAYRVRDPALVPMAPELPGTPPETSLSPSEPQPEVR